MGSMRGPDEGLPRAPRPLGITALMRLWLVRDSEGGRVLAHSGAVDVAETKSQLRAFQLLYWSPCGSHCRIPVCFVFTKDECRHPDMC